MTANSYNVQMVKPHAKQRLFIESTAKRKVVRGGRRGGKTVGVGHLAVDRYLKGYRVLYATPTQDQIERFWYEVKASLQEVIDAGVMVKNETKHSIELPRTEQRIRAKTAWNADSLRGDYADLLIFDEWQLMNEDAWEKVGAPMLLDNNGDAVFIYTPPSAHTRSASKATDPRHAAKMYKRAAADTTGRWEAFHFTSHDNPHIDKEALKEIAQDMTPLAYRMEILAEDIDYVPGALWTPQILDNTRVADIPDCYRIVVAVDPPATTGQAGIVVAGTAKVRGVVHGYVLEDATPPPNSSPSEWATAAIDAYSRWEADTIIGETNQGGHMVEQTIRSVQGDRRVNYQSVHATRGKYTRAEPVSALFNPPPQIDVNPRAHMAGYHVYLEEELCSYVPGMSKSPNRLDAMVWAFVALGLGQGSQGIEVHHYA